MDENCGMQFRDGRSQQRGRFTERFSGSRQRDRLRTVCQFVEIHPRGENVLERPVVQLLGQFCALTLLEPHEFGQKAGAMPDEVPDGQHA